MKCTGRTIIVIVIVIVNVNGEDDNNTNTNTIPKHSLATSYKLQA